MKRVTRIGVYGVILKKKSIILIEKSKGCYGGLLDLPGGGIEFSEKPEEALRREIREELGMQFKEMRFLANVSHTREVHNVQPPFHFHQLGMLYIISNAIDIPNATPEEVFSMHQINSLKENQVTPFTWEAIQLIKDISDE